MTYVYLLFKTIVFLFSAGYFFKSLASKSIILSFLAGFVALISGLFTVEAIYDKVIYEQKQKKRIDSFEKKQIALEKKQVNFEIEKNTDDKDIKNNLEEIKKSIKVDKVKEQDLDIVSLYKKEIQREELEKIFLKYPWLKKEFEKQESYDIYQRDLASEKERATEYLTEEEKRKYKHPTFYNLLKIFGDLNEDNIPELVFTYRRYCGSGGCGFPVYYLDVKNKKIKKIASTNDEEMINVIDKNRINGWYPIIRDHKIGYATSFQTLYIFQNGIYRKIREVEKNIDNEGEVSLKYQGKDIR